MKHDVALWAGVAAFFGSLLAIGAIDLLSLTGAVEFLTSIIVAVITAGAVYSKERLSDAKIERESPPGDPPGDDKALV